MYVTSGNGMMAVIDGRARTVTATIQVTGSAAAVDPKTSTGYVANSLNPGMVSVISGQTNTVTATIPVGQLPAGVAVNPNTSTAYVTNGMLQGKVSVLTPCPS